MENKRLKIAFLAFCFLSIVYLSAQQAFFLLEETPSFVGLLIGVVIMGIAVAIHLLSKLHSPLYLLAIFLNAIAIGCSLTSYYVYKEFHLKWDDYVIATSISMVSFLAFAFVSRMQFFLRHYKIYTSLWILCSFCISLTLWLSNEEFSGLTFYFLNIMYFFFVGLLLSSPHDSVLRLTSFFTFGAFLLISIIVLIVISEGEALSGIGDFDFGSGGIKTKKKKT